MPIRKASCTVALLTALLSSHSATAETTLRIAMTASDIPTATGHAQQRLRGHALPGLSRSSKAGAVGTSTKTDQLATLRAGPGREMGAGARRQEDLDLPSAPGREVPRRHRFQCRRRDLESRPLSSTRTAPQFEPPTPSAIIARARADARQPTRRSTTTPSPSPPPSWRPISRRWCPISCSPRRPRSRRPGKDWAKVATLAGRPAPGRSGSPTWCRARRSTLARNDGYWDPAKKAKVDKSC